MSTENKKPRIYSYCLAGCRWETMHKSEFIEVAPLIRQHFENDRCYLELGKQYKIFATNDNGFSCTISLVYKNNETYETHTFAIPNDDKYADSVVFRLLETTINENTITIIYEIAGIRYIDEITGTSINSENYLYVDNAKDVFIFNPDALYKVEGTDGKSVFIRYATSLSGDDMSETYTGQSYMGVYTGKTASDNPSDYTWSVLGTIDAEGIEAVVYAESERQKTLNLFNSNTITSGYSLNSSNGDLLEDSLWYVSDYINVQGLPAVIISGLRDSGRSNCFYDVNHQYISTFNAITGTIIVPSNAVYMRINGILSQLGEEYTIISQGNIVHENIIQGMAGVELWNNPNKSSSFPSQTITLSSSFANFDYLILEYEAYVPTNGVVNCRAYKYFRPMGGGSLEVLSGGWDNGERYIKARAFKFISETQIEVASGYQEGTNNDRMVVPMRIYGVKKGV